MNLWLSYGLILISFFSVVNLPSRQTLLLNFRFSPNFDYSATHHRLADNSNLPRHRTGTSPYSDASGRSDQLTNDADFHSRYAYPRHFRVAQPKQRRRFIREAPAVHVGIKPVEPLDVKLTRLRARLAELEARQHVVKAQPKLPSANLQFDEEHQEPPADHAEHPPPESHPDSPPAAPPAAETTPTPSSVKKPDSEGRVDRMMDAGKDHFMQRENSRKWADKLHSKHIFQREVQIIGEFPQQIPGNGSETTTKPGTAGDSLEQKRSHLNEVKKKLHELQIALAQKSIQHEKQLEVKKLPTHSSFVNYDTKFIRKKRPGISVRRRNHRRHYHSTDNL